MRKFMLPILMLILLIGAFNPTPSHAQDDTPLWFWATTPDGLVAYTLDGQINVLTDDAVLQDVPFPGTRLTADSALIFDDENRVVYRVTPTTVTPSAPLDEQFDVFRPLEYRHPYVLFTGVRVFPSAGILNVETMEVSPLTGFVFPHAPHIVFLDDTTLRYYSYADAAPGNDTPSTLWERDLVTGEETPLLNFDYGSYRVFYSQDGQQWWVVGLFDPDTQMTEEITTYGDVNPDVTTAVQNLDSIVKYDWVVTMDAFCEADCPVSISPLAGGEARTFTLPTNNSGQFPVIQTVLDDGTLLLYHISSETLYRLDPSGNLLELGQADTLHMTPFLPPPTTQWLVTVNEQEDGSFTYRLWDFAAGELIQEAPLENFIGITYSTNSVLLVNGRYFSLYTGDTMYDLSAHPGRFFQPLAKAQTLYWGSPDEPSGIYLYDAPSDTLTMLVPEGQPIRLAELSPVN